MNFTKKKTITAAVLACLLTLCGCSAPSQNESSQNDASEQEYPVIEAGIYTISKYGNIILTISPETMMEYGYEEADIIDVEIGSVHKEMPVGINYSDVDAGSAICRYDLENDPHSISLAISGGNLAAAMNVADKKETSDGEGFIWIYREGLDENVTVYIRMAEKQGYADEYQIHKVTSTRTNERADYPDLSDAEFANFRAVSTTGMGKDTLYRSSSPINPKIGRNRQADEALSLNGVHTILNLADYEHEMKEYPGYSSTYYSECDIIPLAMSMDLTGEENSVKMAEGLRFIIGRDGPYLIHCLEGKDRTGFVIAVLESLMGASIGEVVEDYMVTYYNFYGVEKGTENYDRIAAVITQLLMNAFGTESLTEFKKNEPLTSYARDYLLRLGLSEQEIEELKMRLAVDYGGQK